MALNVEDIKGKLSDAYKGDFIINQEPITTLKGCPKVIQGDFILKRCSFLKTLMNGPKKVTGDYVIEFLGGDSPKLNKLSHLKGVEIGGSFKIYNDNNFVIRDKKDFPIQEVINGNLILRNTSVSNEIGKYIKEVKGNLDLSHNYNNHIKFLPKFGGSLNISDTGFDSQQFKYLPKEINGTLNISNTQVTDLDGLPNTKGLILRNMNTLTSLKGIPGTIESDFSFSIENETEWEDKYLEYFPKEIKGNFYFKDSNVYEFDDNFPEIQGDIFLDNVRHNYLLQEFLPKEMSSSLTIKTLDSDLDEFIVPRLTKNKTSLTIQGVKGNFKNFNKNIVYQDITLSNAYLRDNKKDFLENVNNVKIEGQFTIRENTFTTNKITIEDIVLAGIEAKVYRINNIEYKWEDVKYIKNLGILSHLLHLK